MSMTSNPTTETMSRADFYTKHSGKNMTVLGACATYDAVPRIAEVYFCPDSHEFTAKMNTGTNPSVIFGKITDFLQAHAGHRMTHCGGVSNDKGVADIWYCQNDNQICCDTVMAHK